MRPTDEITLADYKRLTAMHPKRPKRGGIPRAEQQERTGLSTLLRAGWSVQSPDGEKYRLYKIGEPAMDTGLQDSERVACNRAKELSK